MTFFYYQYRCFIDNPQFFDHRRYFVTGRALMEAYLRKAATSDGSSRGMHKTARHHQHYIAELRVLSVDFYLIAYRLFENGLLSSRTKRPPNNMHKLMCRQKSSINSRTSQRRTPRKAGRTHQVYWRNVALGSWSNHQLIMS